MSLDAALRCFSGAGGMDVATLQSCAQLLDRLPAVATLFGSGALSWADLRQLNIGTRRFRTEQLNVLEAWLDQHGDRLARLDVEHRTDVLDQLLRDLAPARTVDRQAEQLDTVDRFVLQLRLDGSSDSYGTWSPESTTLLAGLLDAEADAPHTTACPPPPGAGHDRDGDRDQDGAAPCGDGDPPISRGQQLAAALLRLVARGRDGAQRPTPPTRFTVLIDVNRLTDQTAGILQTALKGRPTRAPRPRHHQTPLPVRYVTPARPSRPRPSR